MPLPVLNDHVKVQRRGLGPNDGAGNPQQVWATLPGGGDLRAEVTEYSLGAAEAIQAGALAGKALRLVVLRSTGFSRGIAVSDRLIDLADGSALNIRHNLNDGRHSRFLRLLCERGVAT